MEKSDYIFGIRAVIEAIEAGREIDRILIRQGLQGELIGELNTLIRSHRIPVRHVPEERINRVTRKNHQGVVAMLSAVTYHNLGNLVSQLYEDGVVPFIVVLDGITDVRNFGAIARTCECAGVNGIVIPTHGSVSVGADAVKTSAGALNHIPVCREANLVNTVKFLRDAGLQVVAVTEKAEINYTQGNYDTPLALVMGAEDVGIQPDVLRACDTLAGIPMFGKIGSLNVSVAAGVMMYEVVRQRLASNEVII